MSDRDERDGANERDDVRADDAGDEPIAALAAFVEPVERGFLGRLRNRIHRRELAGEVVRLGWYAPVAVFMEFVTMIFGLLSAGADDRGDEGER